MLKRLVVAECSGYRRYELGLYVMVAEINGYGDWMLR